MTQEPLPARPSLPVDERGTLPAGAPAVAARLGLAGSVVALLVASCCVAPTVLIAAGVAGSVASLAGPVAAWSQPVLWLSSLLVAGAAVLAWRRGVLARLGLRIGLAVILLAAAWTLFLREATVNEFIIGLM
jgi:hypothetical protein